jgi:hypothetical protein
MCTEGMHGGMHGAPLLIMGSVHVSVQDHFAVSSARILAE